MSMTAASDSPYQYLVSLDQKCRSNASGLPVVEESRDEWVGVQFVLNGNELLASMDEISEIVSLPPVTRIPGVKPWVVGMANMRGMLLPVIDLERFMYGSSSGVVDGNRRLLVIRQGEVFAGLMIEQIIGMRHYWADEKAAELPGWIDAPLAPLVEVAFQRAGHSVPVFSMKSLIGSEAFMDVAQL